MVSKRSAAEQERSHRAYGTVVRREGGRYVRCLAPDSLEPTEQGPYQDFSAAREALLAMNPPHITVPIAAFDRIIAARKRHAANGE